MTSMLTKPNRRASDHLPSADPMDYEVRQLMTPGVVTIVEDASLVQVYRALVTHRVRPHRGERELIRVARAMAETPGTRRAVSETREHVQRRYAATRELLAARRIEHEGERQLPRASASSGSSRCGCATSRRAKRRSSGSSAPPASCTSARGPEVAAGPEGPTEATRRS